MATPTSKQPQPQSTPAPSTQPQSTPAPTSTPQPTRHPDLVRVINFIVLLLAVLLIVYISYDTFTGTDFLASGGYMTFQFWVCVAFMVSFFIELKLAADKRAYLRSRWVFLILSIPFLNILNLTDIHVSSHALYFLRFIPLARGALAIAIIISYFTRNRITGVFATYTAILLLTVYFCSLIILEAEHTVNPQIPDFGEALWFAFMVVTTIGCDIAPVTVIGKVLQFVLAAMGMIMFPLFTVYITSTVIRLRNRRTSTPTT